MPTPQGNNPRRTITQAELESVLKQYEEASRAALLIRQRINQGAEVEPGPLTADSDGEITPDEMTKETTGNGLGIAGLDISKRKSVIPDWLDYIPSADDDPLYTLSVAGEKDIPLTVDEFIKTRRFVAQLRGYAVPEVSHV